MARQQGEYAGHGTQVAAPDALALAPQVARPHCGDKVTASVIRQLQTKLTAAGYNVPVSEGMNKETKEALMRYQKEHNLPVGNLDVRTLDALGVKH